MKFLLWLLLLALKVVLEGVGIVDVEFGPRWTHTPERVGKTTLAGSVHSATPLGAESRWTRESDPAPAVWGFLTGAEPGGDAVALIGMIPFEALQSAATGRFEAENRSAIEAGVGLAG